MTHNTTSLFSGDAWRNRHLPLGVEPSGDQRQHIAIAHRLSTIAALDRLVVMDQGRIVEEGSHRALLETGGLYSQLWERQSGGFLGMEAQTTPALYG